VLTRESACERAHTHKREGEWELIRASSLARVGAPKREPARTHTHTREKASGSPYERLLSWVGAHKSESSQERARTHAHTHEREGEWELIRASSLARVGAHKREISLERELARARANMREKASGSLYLRLNNFDCI